VIAATPGATIQWQKNGRDVGTPAASYRLTQSPSATGMYTAKVSNGTATTVSEPFIYNYYSREKIAGDGVEVGSDIHHPNGNVYDQILLTGTAVTIKADPGQVSRVSYIDLTDDIVQVEFSGAGSLTLTLDDATGPAAPLKYNQPEVRYMKGHANIVVAGGDATSNVSVFSVGQANAVNQALFLPGVAYDSMADLGYIAVTGYGEFGGIRAANGSFLATQGITGVYAPAIKIPGPVYVGDICAADSATPVLQAATIWDARVAGGDLYQLNGRPVAVNGMTELQFTDNVTSSGQPQAEQPNLGKLESFGHDVTETITRAAH
jgi:hypothetical protein